MVKIGCINRLRIKRTWQSGAYLDGGTDGKVFLAKKHVPPKYQLGDEIEVFVYMDGEGRLRATPQKPFATVGQFAKLKAVAKSSAGTFLDWGLQKDLLVPKREQQSNMEVGKSYVVHVFLDRKSQRIAASSKLDKYLSNDSPAYSEGEEVDLLICGKTDLGYKAIINNSHLGMIFENEVFQKIHIGQKLKGYVKKVRDDLKIDLILQKSGYHQVDDISQGILEKIRQFGGSISVTDKSPPDDIYSLFGVSKKVFKKAIGSLYKKRLISIGETGIKLVKKKRSTSTKKTRK